MTDINKIQEILFIEYKKNGYFDMWENNFKCVNGKFESNFRMADIAELGLIVTEVSEAQEVVRNYESIQNLRQHLKIECIDILKRTFNFMSRKNMLAEPSILGKHSINMRRGYLHNKVL